MNKLCESYYDMLNNCFPNKIRSVIIYGSNIYNESSSDLDACVIIDNKDVEIIGDIIKKTIDFHRSHNLKIDEEIPHENKLVYTFNELVDTINNPPFYKDGKVVINDIVKSKEFLSSKEMKKRLLFNILTTDHVTIGFSVAEYEKKAFKIMVDVVCRYFNIIDKSEDEILSCFYRNKFTGAEGEMFLGYKKNYLEKEKYLREKIREVLND